jgi:hypothetical protein
VVPSRLIEIGKQALFAVLRWIVEDLERGVAWLDTGLPDALLNACNFVQIVEAWQGLKIASLKEIALNLGYIGIDQLRAQAKAIANTEYGQYLVRLAEQSARHPRLPEPPRLLESVRPNRRCARFYLAQSGADPMASYPVVPGKNH